MAIREIPLSRPEGAGSFTQTTDLGGTDYVISLDWVERAGNGIGAWRLDLLTEDGRVIALGRTLVAASLLLARVVDEDRPLGDLIVSTTGTDPPGLDDLGVVARLLFVDGIELDQILETRGR
ncbi:MAG: phage baseplate plug family protein [Acidimicrobiales bacterium]